MDEVQEQFDDPAFREAIRQAAGKPAAPPRLREKVLALMAAAPAAPGVDSPTYAPPRGVDVGSRWRIGPRPPAKLVAAAVLALITVGYAFMQLAQEFEWFAGSVAAVPAQFDSSLALEMTRTHHNCARLA